VFHNRPEADKLVRCNWDHASRST